MLETTHLRMLKWILGVHKKANNNFCYGDTGRTPWTINVLPQCINYFNRASLAEDVSVNTLLHHTFAEQKALNLTWYRTWLSITSTSNSPSPCPSPTQAATDHFRNRFINDWKVELQEQSKMFFYRTVKSDFREEEYLQLEKRSSRVNIARLRSSSHDLLIERSRYSTDFFNKAEKACRFCCSKDRDIITLFEQLPFFEAPIMESEDHVLTECLGYHNIRLNLSENLKSLLMLKEYGLIMNSHHLPEFGKFLTDSFYLRNPRKKST